VKPTRRRIHEIEVDPERIGLEQPLGRFLIVLFRQFEDELLRRLSRAGYRTLTRGDLDLRRHIDPRGTHATEIRRLSGVTKQAVSQGLARLERKGWIVRSADAGDSRAREVRFSKSGAALIEDCIRHIQDIEDGYRAALGSAARLVELKSGLHRLIQRSGDR
jgi:DNA-binding MarR family transcriptional regulator